MHNISLDQLSKHAATKKHFIVLRTDAKSVNDYNLTSGRIISYGLQTVSLFGVFNLQYIYNCTELEK